MVEELLCRQYIELRVLSLRYNNVMYGLEFGVDDDPASPTEGKDRVLKSWKLNKLSVELGSMFFRERVFRSKVGESQLEKVRRRRMHNVLTVVAKFLGWPRITLGSDAPNSFTHEGSYIHLDWEESFEEISSALPASGSTKSSSANRDFKLYKALREIPDSPQGMDDASMLLSLRQFMDLLLVECREVLQNDLDSIWFGALEVSRRLLPHRRWGSSVISNRYNVSLEAEDLQASFTELPSISDQNLVSLSRGKQELTMLCSHVRDSVAGTDKTIEHGWRLIPSRPSAAADVIRTLRQEAANRFKAVCSV